MRPRLIRVLLVLLLVAMPLAACGKKPPALRPPPGEGDSPYPRTYPDPSRSPHTEAAP